MSTSRPFSTPTYSRNFFTPSTNHPTSKRRKGSKDVSDASVIAKRSRSQSSTKILQGKDTNTLTQLSNVSTSSQQYSAVKASPVLIYPVGHQFKDPVLPSVCLISLVNHLQVIHLNPIHLQEQHLLQLTNLFLHQKLQMLLPLITPQQMTSTNCTVIASETITTNMKRFSKRDHVKGKLDFDGSGIATNSDKPITCEAASETKKEVDYFDFGLPNLDVLGPNFSFFELLGDFDLSGEELNYSYQPDMDSSPYSLSGSPYSSEDAVNGGNQAISELSSIVIEIIYEKNMNSNIDGINIL